MKKQIEMNRIFVKHIIGSDADIICQIGGRYSGKSFAMEQLATMNLATKKNYKLLVIEDKEGNVNQGTKSGILSRIEEFEYNPLFTDTKKPAEINNVINKNKAIFKGYTTDDQIKQVKALNEVTATWYEEAENITKGQIEDLYFQLRGGEPQDRKLYLTLNPINPDSYINTELVQGKINKVLEYFPDTRRPKVFEKIVTTKFVYNGKKHTVNIKYLIVITTHHDNAFLTDKQRAAIEALKETDYEKWLQLAEARFIRPGGAFFKEFSKEIHVIEPFVIPQHWDRYSTIDYGLDMLAGLWIAIDEYGKAYIYKKINESDLIISEAARKLKEINNGDDTRIKYAPGDLWNRRQETGKSVNDWFIENNWIMQKADRNRVNGALAIKEWLKVYKTKDIVTGEPKTTANLLIFDHCTELINHLGKVLADEKDSNKYATEPHEITHDLDALRYFCIMRTAPTILKTDTRNTTDKFFNKKVETENTLAGNFY